MSSRILTIDIQEDQISSVLLVHGLKGTRIVETACDPIVTENRADIPFQAIQDALIDQLAKMEKRVDRCLVSLFSGTFFFRTIELPFKNKKKISQILSFELERYLPWPADEIASDFYGLDKNSKEMSQSAMAGVASIKSSDLDQFKALFDACNIQPDVVTVGSGYSEALLHAGSTDPSAFSLFIHLAPCRASIYVVRWGEIALTRTVLIDLDDPSQSVRTALSHTLLSFNEAFNNSLELNEILVSGAASFGQPLCREIEQELNVPVQWFDLFKTIKLSVEPGQFAAGDGVQNAIAMGANDIKGVERYNFSRQVSTLALFYQENRIRVMVLAVLSCLLFFAWAMNPVIRINRMEKRVAQLDTRITRVFKSCFPEVQTIVDPVHQMQVKVAALQKKKNINFFDDYPLCIDLLNDISKSLPSSLDIIFSRFVRTENQLLLTGSADQFNTIDTMKNYFKRIALFKQVDINSATMDKIDKRVKFNLKILL